MYLAIGAVLIYLSLAVIIGYLLAENLERQWELDYVLSGGREGVGGREYRGAHR